jgi:hypothetical protein
MEFFEGLIFLRKKEICFPSFFFSEEQNRGELPCFVLLPLAHMCANGGAGYSPQGLARLRRARIFKNALHLMDDSLPLR